MTDTLNPSYGSPFAQGTRKITPKSVMFRLRSDHPSVSKEEIFRMFKQEANSDPELSDVCIEIAAINAYTAWENVSTAGGKSATGKKTKQEKQKVQENVRKAADRLRRALILDFIMPNEKPLRNCTFYEVAKFGRGFQKLAAAGKPNELVGNVLSEAKARSLLRVR